MQEFEDAKDKIMMGAERRSSAMTEAEKKLTAYHEAGHAMTALNVAVADPLHKATIIPRGRALGMVMQLPEGDRYSMSYKWMVSRLCIMMGGRVAEELTFGKENITSGASSDIEQATKLPLRLRPVMSALKKSGFLLESDPKLPSVCTLITGAPLRSSWWSHPRAQTIFAVNKTVRNSEEHADRETGFRQGDICASPDLGRTCPQSGWPVKPGNSRRSQLKRVR